MMITHHIIGIQNNLLIYAITHLPLGYLPAEVLLF